MSDDRLEERPCSICLDPIAEPADLFVPHCSDKHPFHISCIHAYAKRRLADAVSVDDGEVTVKTALLPRCPDCRAPMTWSHRTADHTRFFLITGGLNNLMELGTVRRVERPHRLELTSHTYTKRRRRVAV